MAATAKDVRLLAPEFKVEAVGDTEIEGWIAAAALEVNAGTWGTLADRGTALMAAHLQAIARPELYQPAVLSEAVGQVSATYVRAPAAGDLASTRFGVEYRRLLSTLGLGVDVI